MRKSESGKIANLGKNSRKSGSGKIANLGRDGRANEKAENRELGIFKGKNGEIADSTPVINGCTIPLF